MQWQEVLVITIVSFLTLLPAVFIWYVNAGGIYAALMYRKRLKLLKKAIPNLTCSINADCPPGFICVEGHCVPQKT